MNSRSPEPAPLKVAILCGPSARHIYVANRLCRAANVVAIVQETGSHMTVGKMVKLLRPDRFWAKAWRWLRDRRRYRGNPEAKFFFGSVEPRLDRPELGREVAYINRPDVNALMDELEPDVIAVFGTTLIRGELLKKGRLGIVNLHGGLSPEYRGADCTFWALYNGEPEKVGCTLHFIDRGIDTGNLIAHICPAVRAGDQELTLFWRAVRDSAEVYAELMGRLAAGERFGQAQPGKGRLYLVRHRMWHHERALATTMRSGLLDDVDLPPRVTWFPREGEQQASSTALASAENV